MSNSKFLPHQDKNNDGLIDACEEVAVVAPADDCPLCKNNPSAIVPDWKTRTLDEPFLNEKECLYQVTAVTSYDNTGYDEGATEEESQAALVARFDEYRDEALSSILASYGLDDSNATISSLASSTQYTDYYLAPRNKSRLKLLFSVPFDVLSGIPAAESEEGDSTAEEDESEATIVVTYNTDDLLIKTKIVKKTLRLYARYFRTYQGVEGGNLLSLSDNSVFDLDKYGGRPWKNKPSILADIVPEIDAFLNKRGYNLPGNLRGTLFNDSVNKITFTFSSSYELKKLEVFTDECGDIPVVFKRVLDKTLKRKDVFKDPTAMAYFTKLNEMYDDAAARVPKPWLQFLKEHTYPAIYDTTNAAYANNDPENTIASCLAEALESEGKQLAQDLLHPEFSIGDIVAYQFRNSACVKTTEELRNEKAELGLIEDPNANNKKRKMLDMAKEQAYKELEVNDQVFSEFCSLILGISPDLQSEEPAIEQDGAGETKAPKAVPPRELWRQAFDKIKLCGLNNMMLDAIQCLFKGMTLEQAMAGIIKSTMRSMSIDNFGKLFVGLPPDKQDEIEKLVKEKIESGEVFKTGSDAQQVSDASSGALSGSQAPGSGDLPEKATNPKTDATNVFLLWTWEAPWRDDEVSSATAANSSAADLESEAAQQYRSQIQNKTLNQQLQFGETSKTKLSPDVVLEAYTLALIEVYNDDLLSVVDELNKFPGAQLVKTLLASVDCPQPPILDPSVYDFIKSVELPFCRTKDEIVLPRMSNPSAWFPSEMDFTAVAFDALVNSINKLVVAIMVKLIVKICQLIGGSICSTVSLGGSLVQSLPPGDCGGGLSEILRDSICGPNADQEKIDNTLIDTFALLGTGGAAFANEQSVLNLAEDISCSMTRNELADLLNGEASDEVLGMMDNLIEYEYPEFRDALSDTGDISSLFSNIGNLLPLDAREKLKNLEGDTNPINPSLCASPEKLEEFCNFRASLLEGRASPEQISRMCDLGLNAQLEDIAAVMQTGVSQHLANNLPPLISDPGCDNGMLPFETDAMVNTTTKAIGDSLESLKSEFATDMFGNGPGKKKWGFINMIMSDTLGNPLSTHHRKVSNRKSYVDFFSDAGTAFGLAADQEGAYPYKVGEWLQEYITSNVGNINFTSNNEIQPDSDTIRTFENLSVGAYVSATEYLSLPDNRYNVDISVDVEEEQVVFTERARKATPDATIEFRDNAKGDDAYPDRFSEGHNLHLYLGDLEQDGTGMRNVPGDSIRILIENVRDTNVSLDKSKIAYGAGKLAELGASNISTEIAQEFFAIDNTLEGFDFANYQSFNQCFVTHQEYTPQVTLLSEILQNNGEDLSPGDIKATYDQITTNMLQKLLGEIAGNEKSYLYGAQFDNLTAESAEYLTSDGERYYSTDLTDDDGVLGVSRDQYDNEQAGTPENTRVFYLDPSKYGGNYMNPPVYIKPMRNEGWLGLINHLFPEMSPCKPHSSDLVDFGSIQQKIDDTYAQIPEDDRLKSDPDCIREAPYQRILQRPSVAGIEGTITSAIRIFAATHFFKTLNTFTKFKPDFDNMYSNIYAMYIIEDMRKSFSDPQSASWEISPFKDVEFWYAFLEQSVQLYNRRIDSGDIEIVPPDVTRSLEELNELVVNYDYPDKNDLREERSLSVGIFTTLKQLRDKKKYEFLKDTEERAKNVLKELVKEELTYMSSIFLDNLEKLDMSPEIDNMGYYALMNFTQGSSLDLSSEIKETTVDLPTEGEELYTSGGQFTTSDGEDYVGYYHVNITDTSNIEYMVGEFHVADDHDVLTPIAALLEVAIGDIAEYGTVASSISTSQPFVVEKYISINGFKYNTTEAIDIIKANDGSLNISDVYPGTLELVLDAGGRVVGLQGELGVRYGIEFSIMVDSSKRLLSNVEIDALDTPIEQIAPLQSNSKLLLCLINNLVDSEIFKLTTQYIFPLNKLISTTAIYNDLNFLPSIGELVVTTTGDYNGASPTRPGMKVNDDQEEVLSMEGWAPYGVRPPYGLGTPFVLEFDDWDQILLRNCKSRIKRMFRTYYNFRKFEPTETKSPSSESPAALSMRALKEATTPPIGHNILPRWKKRQLVNNPFNADGQLCEKKD